MKLLTSHCNLIKNNIIIFIKLIICLIIAILCYTLLKQLIYHITFKHSYLFKILLIFCFIVIYKNI